MCAGMGEVFALEVDAGAGALREAGGRVERRGATAVGTLLLGKLRGKGGVMQRGLVGSRQLVERGHQALRNEAPTEVAEAPASVRVGAMLVGLPLGAGSDHFCRIYHNHTLTSVEFAVCAAVRAARTNARIFSGSFTPLVSTPLLTSTPRGLTNLMALPTFSGVRPPERMMGQRRAASRASSQLPILPVPPYSPLAEGVSSRGTAPAST